MTRFIKYALVLSLGVVGLGTTACSKDDGSVVPTSVGLISVDSADSGPRAVPLPAPETGPVAEQVRVLAVTFERIDVEIAGSNGERDVMTMQESAGVLDVSINGKALNLTDATGGEKTKLAPAALAAAATALRVYGAWEVIRSCAPPVYDAVRARRLSDRTWDDCLWKGSMNVASSGLAKIVGNVGVTKLRADIYSGLRGAVSWRNLTEVLNKKTFRSVAAVVSELTVWTFEAIYNGMLSVIRRY